jgi:hypothetical protein
MIERVARYLAVLVGVFFLALGLIAPGEAWLEGRRNPMRL